MKALQMLDHVMLWVARIFTFLVFVTLSLFVEENFRLIFEYDLRETFFWRCIHSLQPGGSTMPLVILILSALSILSLWLLRKDICRLYLGLLSVVLLLVFACFIGSNLLSPVHPPFDWKDSITLLGYAAMLWVSIRPPKSTQNSDHSINRVNLVNPV